MLLALTTTSFAGEDISTLGLTVSGKDIVNGTGQKVYLHGFNSYGSAQKCHDGFNHVLPNGTPYTRSFNYFQRMKQQWNVNTFRVMINEWCWKNNTSIGGVAHRDAIKQLVDSLVDNNMVPVITLAAARNLPTTAGNKPTLDYGDTTMAMPNELNSREVWVSLANTFKASADPDYSRIIFDAYNEPTPYLCQNRGPPDQPNQITNFCSITGATSSGARPNCNLDVFQFNAVKASQCILNGGASCAGSAPSNANLNCMIPGPADFTTDARNGQTLGSGGYLGMQSIVNIIRNAGATNIILIPGFNYSGDLTKWIEFRPTDNQNNLAASKHNYSFSTGNNSENACRPGGGFAINTPAACRFHLEAVMKANGIGTLVGASAPVIYGEFGTRIANDPATGNPPNPGCQENVFIDALVNYAREKQQGFHFHDSWGLRNPAVGLPPHINPPANRPCTNFQAFSDYGEGVSRDGVVDDGDTIIEPTVYGAPYKTLIANDSWTYGGGGSDTTPDFFSFYSVNNVNPNSIQLSNSITVSGINAAAPISVSAGSSYEIDSNGVFLTTPSSINNGQSVRVAHLASGANSTTVTTTLTIGGVNGTFSSTTKATTGLDTTPDTFTLNNVNNVPLNLGRVSDPIIVSGINTPAPISVSSGSSYDIGLSGNFVVTPGTVGVGLAVRVAHFAAPTNSTSVTTILNVGGITGFFTSTTLAAAGPDTTPDSFTLNSVSNVALNSIRVSNQITLSGINAPTPISVSSGSSYDINSSGNFVTTPGTVNITDTVRVAHLAAPTNSTTVTTILNVGGVTRHFSSTTVAAP